jgi:hypothetical protein
LASTSTPLDLAVVLTVLDKELTMDYVRRIYVSVMTFAVVAVARVAELGLDNHTP